MSDDLVEALRKIIAEDDTGPMVYEPRQVGAYTISQAVGGSEGKFAAIARAAISKVGDPAADFARWAEQGPRLAVAAGVYVGIKVYASEADARKVGDIS